MNKKQVSLILKAVGMAMGVAVVTLGFIANTPLEAKVTMLGIGVFALGLAALNGEQDSR